MRKYEIVAFLPMKMFKIYIVIRRIKDREEPQQNARISDPLCSFFSCSISQTMIGEFCAFRARTKIIICRRPRRHYPQVTFSLLKCYI